MPKMKTAPTTPAVAAPNDTATVPQAHKTPPSDIELVITAARRIEALLEKYCVASGRGLHEKLSSIPDMLPPKVLYAGRYIATIRNKVVHMDAFSIPNRTRFLRCAQIIEDHFEPQTHEAPDSLSDKQGTRGPLQAEASSTLDAAPPSSEIKPGTKTW
jgi:hypothetical protein